MGMLLFTFKPVYSLLIQHEMTGRYISRFNNNLISTPDVERAEDFFIVNKKLNLENPYMGYTTAALDFIFTKIDHKAIGWSHKMDELVLKRPERGKFHLTYINYLKGEIGVQIKLDEMCVILPQDSMYFTLGNCKLDYDWSIFEIIKRRPFKEKFNDFFFD